MVAKNSARGWIASSTSALRSRTNKVFSMWDAAICTSAWVWRWRDSKYDDASSTPTMAPAEFRMGDAVQEMSPNLVKKCSGPLTATDLPRTSAVPRPLVPATCSDQWLPTTMLSPDELMAKRLSA